MGKIYIISDNNKKSQRLKNFYIKKLKLNPFKKFNLKIIIGGDGFMLKSIKKSIKSNTLFYGINTGNFGFLMNKFNYHKAIKNLNLSKIITISPLEMRTKNKKNKTIRFFAINEVSVLRQNRQAANLSIKKGNNYIIKKLVSDGVLVSTPAGSTAYNLSVNGPILSINSKKITVSPISPFRPRRWAGKILSDNSIIKIKNLDPKKRPVSAVADNIETRNIKSLSIRINKKIKINLLYDRSRSLHKKIKLEQSIKSVY